MQRITPLSINNLYAARHVWPDVFYQALLPINKSFASTFDLLTALMEGYGLRAILILQVFLGAVEKNISHRGRGFPLQHEWKL